MTEEVIEKMYYEFGLLTTRETMIVDRVIELMEQENEQLKAQIEKMKCCENCNWWYRLPNGQKDCAETNCEKLSHWTMRIKE